MDKNANPIVEFRHVRYEIGGARIGVGPTEPSATRVVPSSSRQRTGK